MIYVSVFRVQTCQNKDVEFRGQLCGLGSLPPALWGMAVSSPGASAKHCFPVNNLTCPSFRPD